ncbi:MAG: transposase [Lentisphaeraceae bacterium]|nr:transposase [Lentisphaeraceae bacterium]
MIDQFNDKENWYNRGYLPHYDANHTLQFITYRLADSLPHHINSEESNLTFQTIDTTLDQNLGSCLLQYPDIALIIKENWLHFNQKEYDILSYVIMPNHVHMLIKTQKAPLTKILHSWKSYTSKKIYQKLQESTFDIHTISKNIWQEEYWDTFIRDEAHLNKVLAYIADNPIKAGLVNNISDYPWYFGPYKNE